MCGRLLAQLRRNVIRRLHAYSWPGAVCWVATRSRYTCTWRLLVCETVALLRLAVKVKEVGFLADPLRHVTFVEMTGLELGYRDPNLHDGIRLILQCVALDMGQIHDEPLRYPQRLAHRLASGVMPVIQQVPRV